MVRAEFGIFLSCAGAGRATMLFGVSRRRLKALAEERPPRSAVWGGDVVATVGKAIGPGIEPERARPAEEGAVKFILTLSYDTFFPMTPFFPPFFRRELRKSASAIS